MKNYKLSFLQLILTVVFVSSLMISNIIVGKQIEVLGLTIPSAVFIFPIIYILSDVFSEVYGYRWSRTTCYIAFCMNLLMVVVFSLVILAPFPEYFGNQSAYEIVLGNTPKILLASSLGFIAGDFVNDRVFRAMKRKHPDTHEKFGRRAILSSLFGEITDSLIFMPIAFIGVLPLEAIAQMFVIQVSFKVIYEIVALPLNKFVVRKVSKFESESSAS